jgi:hypothetical protein
VTARRALASFLCQIDDFVLAEFCGGYIVLDTDSIKTFGTLVDLHEEYPGLSISKKDI